MHVHSAKYWRWHHDQECSGLPWAFTHLQQHASNNMVPPTKCHNAHSILKTELECDCCAASASSQPECMTQWMPSPSGGHNSSMPLATLRAQSITDSQPFHWSLSTRFPAGSYPTHPRKKHTRRYLTWLPSYCVTDASRRQEPEDISDEDAKCRALAQLSTQQHLREGFLRRIMSCSQAQGLLWHFKLIRVRSDSKFLPYSLQWRGVKKQHFSLSPPALDEKKTTQNARNWYLESLDETRIRTLADKQVWVTPIIIN